MTHRKTTKKVPPHIARWIDLMEMVKDYKEMFETINKTCRPSERVPMTPANVDYYAQQIWNMTNEGDLPEKECMLIAKHVCGIIE